MLKYYEEYGGRLNQSVYVLPQDPSTYDSYVVQLDPNSAVYNLANAFNNESIQVPSNNYLVYAPTYSINYGGSSTCSTWLSYSQLPIAFSNSGNSSLYANNSYGIIGEFMEVATLAN